VDWLKIVLGLLLLLAVAVAEFRRRPHGHEQAAMPRWMSRVDTIKPGGVAAPVVIYFAIGKRSADVLTGLKD